MNTTHSHGRRFVRTVPAFAAVGVLALGLTACGSDNNSDSTSTDSSATTTAAAPKPAAQIKTINSGTTAVTLDAGFVKALGTLKLTPAPVGKAKISKAGVATFPVTGGNITYYKPGTVSPYVQGVLDHKGSGLSLTGGSTKVELENFVIDPGASVLTGKVVVNGKTAVPSAPLFFLDGRTLQPLKTTNGGKDAVLEGTTVKLKQEAADLLNKTFGTDALKAGLVIGVAKITVPTGG